MAQSTEDDDWPSSESYLRAAQSNNFILHLSPSYRFCTVTTITSDAVGTATAARLVRQYVNAMPVPPLAGHIGDHIKLRLDSAVIRCTPTSWEDLYLYIIQDQEWKWDDQIVLAWRQDISYHFLQCCAKLDLDAETIESYQSALEDGIQDINLDSSDEFHDAVEGGSGEPAITAAESSGSLRSTQHTQHGNRPPTIMFLVRFGNRNCDGAAVGYAETPMSRISSKVALVRWGMEGEIYEQQVQGTGEKVQLIDLTWELRQGQARKTYETTFKVVLDDEILFDAEFGTNRFDGSCRKRPQGHSSSKSESDIRKESRLPHRLKARSHTGPAAFSSSKHVDYEAQLVVAGMRILAAQREAEERFSLQGRDDSSGTPSMRDSGSSANTSNSTKSLHSGRKASKKRRGR